MSESADIRLLIKDMFTNSGTVQAHQNLILDSSSTHNTGVISAKTGDSSLNIIDHLDSSGALFAKETSALQPPPFSLQERSNLIADNIQLDAQELMVGGHLSAAGTLSFHAESISLDHSVEAYATIIALNALQGITSKQNSESRLYLWHKSG